MTEPNHIIETTYLHWRRSPGKLAADERSALVTGLVRLFSDYWPGHRLANEQAVEHEIERLEAKMHG